MSRRYLLRCLVEPLRGCWVQLQAALQQAVHGLVHSCDTRLKRRHRTRPRRPLPWLPVVHWMHVKPSNVAETGERRSAGRRLTCPSYISADSAAAQGLMAGRPAQGCPMNVRKKSNGNEQHGWKTQTRMDPGGLCHCMPGQSCIASCQEWQYCIVSCRGCRSVIVLDHIISER